MGAGFSGAWARAAGARSSRRISFRMGMWNLVEDVAVGVMRIRNFLLGSAVRRGK